MTNDPCTTPDWTEYYTKCQVYRITFFDPNDEEVKCDRMKCTKEHIEHYRSLLLDAGFLGVNYEEE